MKKHRRLKIFLGIPVVWGLFVAIVNIIPPKIQHKDNPFISKDKVMLVAHRGGAITNPENTMKAFKGAVNDYKADIIETDLWMTKDGYLVFNHDGTLNRTTDVSIREKNFDEGQKYYIKDYTLDELRRFNFGYQFVDKAGNRPYKDLCNGVREEDRYELLKNNGLSITELHEFFNEFYNTNKDLLFILEIKDGGEAGKKATKVLYDTLKKEYPEYLDNMVLGTFHDEIEEDINKNYPDIYRGASPKVVIEFVITQLLCVNLFENNDIVCFQLPLEEKGICLHLSTFINRAHRKNIAVQYWTINDRESMEMLIKKKVDAIMSDDIELLREVLDSKLVS